MIGTHPNKTTSKAAGNGVWTEMAIKSGKGNEQHTPSFTYRICALPGEMGAHVLLSRRGCVQ